MKFEEVLPLLRDNKKIQCKSYDKEGEYWVAGYASIPILEVEEFLTIHRLNKNGDPIVSINSWGMPLWVIMADDWEALE